MDVAVDNPTLPRTKNCANDLLRSIVSASAHPAVPNSALAPELEVLASENHQEPRPKNLTYQGGIHAPASFGFLAGSPNSNAEHKF